MIRDWIDSNKRSDDYMMCLTPDVSEMNKANLRDLKAATGL